jgi:glucans biosynthesis protein C
VSIHIPSVASGPSRLYFLDWLRIIALMALILYHVGMYYVRWDFHVKSPFAGAGLEPWMKLSGPWRMDLLFMVSGAATALMLKAGSTASLLRKRTKFLLLPLLCGMVLIVPPQAYFEVVQKFAYQGNYLDFLKLYFGHYKGFCQSGNCLILPTWNHLWFLPYLWLYTVLLLGCGQATAHIVISLRSVGRAALGGGRFGSGADCGYFHRTPRAFRTLPFYPCDVGRLV